MPAFPPIPSKHHRYTAATARPCGGGTVTFTYRCVGCGSSVDSQLAYDCPDCGGILDVTTSGVNPAEIDFDGRVGSLWKYEPLLPVSRGVSLGEGGTPTVNAADVAASLDADIDLWLKHEGINPTCSFKDRASAVGLSYAATVGEIDTAVISSHGNAWASLAAYANRVGIDPVVLVPRGSAAGLPKVQACGARTVRIDGDISDTYRLARAAADAFGWYNATTTHQVPLANAGHRTMAYELFDQLGHVPDWILIPVSAGPLLTQTYRGFQELRSHGLVETVPSFACVQASGCAPIVRAADAGIESVSEWRDAMNTVATSIEDPLRGYAKDGTYTLQVVRETNGAAIACEDDEIRRATRDLVEREGVLTETASAATVAALHRLVDRDDVESGDSVVAAITGHGMNEVEKLAGDANPPYVQPTVEALRAAVAED